MRDQLRHQLVDRSLGERAHLVFAVRAGDKSFQVIARVDTPQEVEYIAHGGILQYVLRQRAAQMKQT